MKRPPLIIVQLVHILGPMKGQIQEFMEPVISIGRNPDSHLRFPADLTSISRRHAEIIREGNQFRLVDHSANGTFVNGKRVKEGYLKNGDVLTFAEMGGPKVSFLTQMKEAPADEEVTPSRQEEKLEERPESVQDAPPRSEPRVQPDKKLRGSSRPAIDKEAHSTPLAMEQPSAVSVEVVKVPLTIQYGPTIRSYKELPVTIGKSPDCQCVLDHPGVYDKHAQIFFSQDQYWVKDLTGMKLVQKHGSPIQFQAPLSVNDEVALSPQGPFFRYIGEGRLAESFEVPAQGSPQERKKEETNPPKAQPAKGVFSKFKKLF